MSDIQPYTTPSQCDSNSLSISFCFPLGFPVAISKPLPLDFKDSYSWIWWLRSIHFKNTEMKMSQAYCNHPEKSSLWEGLRCWMCNFLFQKELATNPFCLQVLRRRAFSFANKASFAHSALKAKDICLGFNGGKIDVQLMKSLMTGILFTQGFNWSFGLCAIKCCL